MGDQDRTLKALAEHAPLLMEWLSSTDLNPQAIERGRQVQRFIDAVRAPSEAARRIILVLGPESSGTRVVTRMCVEAGCIGDWGHKQRWDKEDPEDGVDLLVYRQSFPHGGETPDVSAICARFFKLGFGVHPVVVVRDWRATVYSQVAAGHSKSESEAEWKIRRALLDIVVGLRRAAMDDYRLVTYESLESSAARADLGRHLGLSTERFASFGFESANTKHY